ncbi:MAG TPA: DUF1501 domain-containing protein [Pirellulaceae bacterium]|nr:DUF1501 domain-containing protein [Pirellulaceae bacterium]
MLTLHSTTAQRDCSGLSRRDFLRIGSLGLGALSLPSLLRARASAAETGSVIRDKSVVLVFLGGGASHIETFNPNMSAPAPYRSVTGEVATTIPGVTLGGNFPGLARHMRKLSLVRSFRHPTADHVSAIIHVLSGGTRLMNDAKGYSMGSVYARLRGANHPTTGLPTYSLLTAPETDSQYRSEKSRVQAGSTPGSLGAAYAPFDPTGDKALENMQLKIPVERLADRRRLLRSLDGLRRDVDASGAMTGLDRFEQQAVELVTRGASEAFDIEKEDPRLVERYDTSMFRIGNFANRPQLVRPSTLGHQMLLARRLCEAGVGFVTVQCAGWDNHADGNNPGILDGMNMLGPPLDKALSAFLDDVEQRGLSDKILLVVTGDFGRTPKINARGGRDHWSNLGTLALAGGGLRMGQVIGQSARQNDVPATDPIGPGNLMSTIMHTMFDVGRLRLQSGLPTELLRTIQQHEPIRELV